MQEVKYYQVGGWRAHVRSNSNDALTTTIFNSGAELVLGIRPTGASYLLVTEDEYFKRRLGRPLHNLWRANQFYSLSPIQFATWADLAAKLKSLTSNKKSSGTAPRDRSQANTAYTTDGDPEIHRVDGMLRSSFEQQRVFYRLFQGMIPDPRVYALNLAPWFNTVRVYSFAFNLWAADMRTLEERIADPRVLDVGWTKFDAPNEYEDLKAVSSTHVFVKEDGFLNNPGRKRLSLPTVTQSMPRDTIKTLLQNLFAHEWEEGYIPPKLLLVYDTQATFRVLRSFGVDTSKWATGINDILYCADTSRIYYRTGQHGSARSDLHDRKSQWSRERSRSPRNDRRTSTDERSTRPCSPSPRRPPPPVYVVDVQELYSTLSQLKSQGRSLLSDAKALSVQDTALVRSADDQVIYEEVDTSQWLLGYMWEAMANSAAIDEQRILRQIYAKEEPVECSGVASGHAFPPEDDEDIDPNDIPQPMAQAAPPQKKSAPIEFNSDDSDYDEP
ncbi:hypothetical protein C8Q74DRAFT_1313473 [Fomes fomentarius]|nr:hypothetical protein C8Q74DRAFT_1313473 [Fomes fomentarius]